MGEIQTPRWTRRISASTSDYRVMIVKSCSLFASHACELGSILPGLDEYLLGCAAGAAGHALEVGLDTRGLVDLRKRFTFGHLELHHPSPTLCIAHGPRAERISIDLHVSLPEGLAILSGKFHLRQIT